MCMTKKIKYTNNYNDALVFEKDEANVVLKKLGKKFKINN